MSQVDRVPAILNKQRLHYIRKTTDADTWCGKSYFASACYF